MRRLAQQQFAKACNADDRQVHETDDRQIHDRARPDEPQPEQRTEHEINRDIVRLAEVVQVAAMTRVFGISELRVVGSDCSDLER